MKQTLNDMQNPSVQQASDKLVLETQGGHKSKTKIEDKVFVVCNTIVLGLFLLVTLYPILNTLAISFTDGVVASMGGIHILPKDFTWENYQTVFKIKTFGNAVICTVARTVIGSALALLANALLAFVISRKKFLFRSELSLFWVITMYVNGGLIPGILLMRYLHFINTFWVYIIPGMISAWNVMVLRTYMEDLPQELEESAMLDGAGYMTIFFRIITPLCKPVYATVLLFVAVGQWNSWFDVLLYNVDNEKHTTLQFELQKLMASVDSTKSSQNFGALAQTAKTSTNNATMRTVRAAASIVTMVPIICIYPFLQRYFVTGLTIGGVKG